MFKSIKQLHSRITKNKHIVKNYHISKIVALRDVNHQNKVSKNIILSIEKNYIIY